jgi:hypothetical protein
MNPYKWLSREEWAYRQQHPYWDCETGCPFADKYKHRLSDYATPREVETLVAGLKDNYRDCGRRMKEAKQLAGYLNQQPGEIDTEHWHRIQALPKEEQDKVHAVNELRWARKGINEVLAHIREDSLPNLFGHYHPLSEETKALLAPFKERYDTARKAAEAEWQRECEQIPVDDAAWEQELRRRKSIDEYFARSPIIKGVA